jgi:hypothetical protein
MDCRYLEAHGVKGTYCYYFSKKISEDCQECEYRDADIQDESASDSFPDGVH